MQVRGGGVWVGVAFLAVGALFLVLDPFDPKGYIFVGIALVGAFVVIRARGRMRRLARAAASGDLGAAAAIGPFTFSHEGGPPFSVDDPAARVAILRTMREHGIVPGAGVDLRSNPRARAAVLATMRRHGIDPERGTAQPLAAAAETPAPPAAPAARIDGPGGQLGRLQALMDLRARQLITDEEFEQHKQRILSDV